ncbi:MAG: hypothetical protein PHT00_04090 [Candidatus Methanomethylophilus sp.]|nr:hypothetical protein [Methanomethylophilus sp.]MDD3233330.1 hypothetical protein [Methanomethylophilus sp.]MDD4222623.1 hypothetical protein [Methanomethylophilus sp.]MDD4668882.1 hypothetical protein [Methanomethylophilus sp.]
MSFFGLTDPYIWGAYVACFLCVIVCCAIGLMVKKDTGEEEDE